MKIEIENKVAIIDDKHHFEFEIIYENNEKFKFVIKDKKQNLPKNEDSILKDLETELIKNYLNKFLTVFENDNLDLKMYKIDDDIFVDELGVICIYKDEKYINTDFSCDIDLDYIEETPINLAKLLIFFDDSSEEESINDYKEQEYISFKTLREKIKEGIKNGDYDL